MISISEPQHHESSHCLPQLIPKRQQADLIKIKPINPTQNQHMLPNHSMMQLSSQSTLMQEEEEAPKLQ